MPNCFEKNKDTQPLSSPVKTILVSAVVLIDRDGRILLATRPAGKAFAGLWEFPGGKIEAGETPEMALIRELKEELGIDTSTSCLAPISFASHSYDNFHLIMPLYACRVWENSVTAKEGQKLKWVYPKDLDKYKMPPADIPLIAAIKELL